MRRMVVGLVARGSECPPTGVPCCRSLQLCQTLTRACSEALPRADAFGHRGRAARRAGPAATEPAQIPAGDRRARALGGWFPRLAAPGHGLIGAGRGHVAALGGLLARSLAALSAGGKLARALMPAQQKQKAESLDEGAAEKFVADARI